MNKSSLLFLTFPLLLLSCQSNRQENTETDYTQYVNPFIGTQENGHTFPGACMPFGMVQASPETGAIGWRYCSGYNNEDKHIIGFAQTHLNGTGCLDFGDILIQPVTGRRIRSDYKSSFDKANETATPGYYSVILSDYGVKAEITATHRTSMYRFTYDRADSASMLIDLQHGLSWNENQYHTQIQKCETEWENDSTLTGEVWSQVWVPQRLYFVMTFDRPKTELITLPKAEGEKGDRYIASFDMKNGDCLNVKIAISGVSIDGAKKNFAAESAGKTFEEIRENAKDVWNQYLSKIEITGSKDRKESFYTSMYHLFIQPSDIADVDGMYRGANDSVYQAKAGEYYSTFSTWDTYRAAHPLYTIIAPEAVDGFVNSMIAHTDVQGFLPIWALWGKESYIMVANHAVPVVVEAYRKGFTGFDAEKAFESVKKSLTTEHRNGQWSIYDKYGYYPTGIVATESVSKTLESSYDDYCAWIMAESLGKTDDAEFFKKRAGYWKNLFDTTTLLMRPRHADGSWLTPFNPFNPAHAESVGGDYTEANAWQYTWHVQQDVPGLIECFGSKERFLNQLDSLFIYDASLMGKGLSDITGLIGLYAHGNEPSHHVAYLYTLAGRPWRTQELVRQLCDTMYLNKPDGLCGNDDCGQMSAWYIFNTLGFYPVDPVSCQYVIGAPQAEEAIVKLPEGKTFTVRAKNLSEANKYVQSITLNGKPYDKNTISHSDVMNGGIMEFVMTDRHE